MGLLNEINVISNGNLMFHLDKYPNLVKLYNLLNAAFNSSINGVHAIYKEN